MCTFAQQAGTLKVGQYAMLKARRKNQDAMPDTASRRSCLRFALGFPHNAQGKPCRLTKTSTHKGRHGAAKIKCRGKDLFTGKAYEDSSPTRAAILVPTVTKRDLFLMDVTPEGYASLLDEATGAARADLQLPAPGARLRARIEAALGAGLEVTVVVTAALGTEAITAFKARRRRDSLS